MHSFPSIFVVLFTVIDSLLYDVASKVANAHNQPELRIVDTSMSHVQRYHSSNTDNTQQLNKFLVVSYQICARYSFICPMQDAHQPSPRMFVLLSPARCGHRFIFHLLHPTRPKASFVCLPWTSRVSPGEFRRRLHNASMQMSPP